MKSQFKKATLFIGIFQAFDLIVLNIMYILLYYTNLYFFHGPSIIQHTFSYWMIGNVTYLFSINYNLMMLHDRLVRPETIVSKVWQAIVLQVILFLAVLALLRIPSPSLAMLLIFYVPTFVVISLGQLFVYHIIKHFRYTGYDNLNVILIGSGENMNNLADIMQDRWNGYRLMGVFTDEESNYYKSGIQRLGDIDDVIDYISVAQVNELYCGLPSNRKEDILPIINYCENHLIRFYNVPNLQNYLKRNVTMRRMSNIIVLSIRKEPLSVYYNRLLKRFFDFTVSTLFLCTLYPFMYIIIGTIIKLTSPGPVYFKQKRTGLDGKVFTCIKFRSMQINNECDMVQATKDDERITGIGKFLRHYNLDEFPQFINVWKDEMSIVGPRPHMVEHTEYYSKVINKYMLRHLVKPGITGYAQVSGFRGETKIISDMEGRIKKDIWYIENWTFWLDINIIVSTIVKMINGDDSAY